jgi:hypothetical protein
LSAFKSKTNLSNPEIRSTLEDYLNKRLGDGQCNNIRKIAKELICGTPESAMKKLIPLIHSLRSDGHMAEAILSGKDRFIQAWMTFQQGRHERQQKP